MIRSLKKLMRPIRFYRIKINGRNMTGLGMFSADPAKEVLAVLIFPAAKGGLISVLALTLLIWKIYLMSVIFLTLFLRVWVLSENGKLIIAARIWKWQKKFLWKRRFKS